VWGEVTVPGGKGHLSTRTWQVHALENVPVSARVATEGALV
jgi:hypothetical protein